MDEAGHDHDSEWQQWWDARVSALESLLGPSDEVVGHAIHMRGPSATASQVTS